MPAPEISQNDMDRIYGQHSAKRLNVFLPFDSRRHFRESHDAANQV